MFYKQFSKITNALNSDFVEEFDFWLSTLPDNRQKNITASLVAGKFNVTYSQADIILHFSEKEKILQAYYLVICPNEECSMIIRESTLDELSDILGHKEYCHICEHENIISPNDICIAYKRIRKPDASDEEIKRSLLKRITDDGDEINFSTADFLGSNSRNLYKVYYSPDESAYKEMAEMKNHLDDNFPNTTEKGAALERLVLYMFKLIKYVSGTNSLKTYTNQFDCTMKFPFSGQGYPKVLEYLTPYFIIECKNEKSSPSNTYFHKISDIMNGNEAQLGIVFSRKKAGKPALDVARETYLLHAKTNKKRNLISFSDEDLKKIIDDKENLLEYLEWKIITLTTNAKNSEFEMFKLRDDYVDGST